MVVRWKSAYAAVTSLRCGERSAWGGAVIQVDRELSTPFISPESDVNTMIRADSDSARLL
jgi:hypothetical protein